jgi:peptidyl-prolyl cis-trans isomerase D
VLSQMRSLAKYIWVLVALAFVGGFLLYETSGLTGRTPVTPTTAVAVVNGREILYRDYTARVQQQIQSEQQRAGGQSLSEDETHRVENSVFDQMVQEVLLDQEYQRRGITVTDDEVRQFARFDPPDWIVSAPELQTQGKFDPEKYQRLLASPQAREGGLLLQLEAYFRGEIPKDKLFDQIASGVYVTNEELWQAWRDQHDSAQVSYVAFTPTVDSATMKSISDADLRAYFDAHTEDFQGPGRAKLSVAVIPRSATAADTAAARAHALALRDQIVKGAKFEDVARRESADSSSAVNGGDLGMHAKGYFVPEFEKAEQALKPGEISPPVATPFGFHLIRVDARKGDSTSAHHILVRVQISDSAASRIDKEADSLAKIAGSSEVGAKLDSAAKHLHLTVISVQATEDQPAMFEGRVIPSVSAWAFGGAHAGETSELFDDDNGYYLARLDSLHPGGSPRFEDVRDEVRRVVAQQRALDNLLPQAQKLATAAAASTLEAAAQQAGKTVAHTPTFARTMMVPGLGQFSEPVGAAFALPTGAVSQPIKSTDGVYVLRVDSRRMSDSTAWAAQRDAQRATRLQQLREQKIRMYLIDLRQAAKIDDHRKQINAAMRRTDV